MVSELGPYGVGAKKLGFRSLEFNVLGLGTCYFEAMKLRFLSKELTVLKQGRD